MKNRGTEIFALFCNSFYNGCIFQAKKAYGTRYGEHIRNIAKNFWYFAFQFVVLPLFIHKLFS